MTPIFKSNWFRNWSKGKCSPASTRKQPTKVRAVSKTEAFLEKSALEILIRSEPVRITKNRDKIEPALRKIATYAEQKSESVNSQHKIKIFLFLKILLRDGLVDTFSLSFSLNK
jgi:hypothetical protein